MYLYLVILVWASKIIIIIIIVIIINDHMVCEWFTEIMTQKFFKVWKIDYFNTIYFEFKKTCNFNFELSYLIVHTQIISINNKKLESL